MFIKYLDFISPPITFHHKGHLSHFSVVSGIISIISFVIIFIIAIQFSLEIIKRKNPAAYYFNTFTKDAGIFPLNSSSLFHFISIAQNTSNLVDNGVNFRNFRIVGLNTFIDYYKDDKNISKYEHWLYGKCNNKTDTEGISHLIEYKFFENSACIKKYFNSSNKQYYDIGDPNFKWPVISHGTLNPKIQFYSIIIERCREDTLNLILGEGQHCKNDKEMKDLFINVGSSHLYYIDNYIDVLNYENPTTKFFQNVETGLHISDYTVNHLNLNPTLVRTYNGLVFDKSKEELSYSFERNDAYSFKNGDSEIYTIYYFWLKNRENYYERTYKKIQDVISSIGGIYQVTVVIASIINRLYNKYIVLCDTEMLLFYSIYTEKKTFIKKQKSPPCIVHENKEPREFNYNEQKKYLNSDIIPKKTAKISNVKISKINEGKPNDETINSNKTDIILSRNYKISNSNTDCGDKSEDQFIQELNKLSKAYYEKKTPINLEDKKSIENIYTISNVPTVRVKPTIKNIPYFPKEKKENRKFINYLIFFFSCKNKNKYFKVYEDFRTNIISEEHLIRNHLNIYNLIKISQRKRNLKRPSYQLKDLIKLV